MCLPVVGFVPQKMALALHLGAMVLLAHSVLPPSLLQIESSTHDLYPL